MENMPQLIKTMTFYYHKQSHTNKRLFLKVCLSTLKCLKMFHIYHFGYIIYIINYYHIICQVLPYGLTVSLSILLAELSPIHLAPPSPSLPRQIHRCLCSQTRKHPTKHNILRRSHQMYQLSHLTVQLLIWNFLKTRLGSTIDNRPYPC